MVLVLCEMQSASSRIWTRAAVSISYDDNHYTTGTSALIDGFPLELEWPQIPGTLLSCLVDLKVVVWMVSTCIIISNSSSPFTDFEVGCSKCINYDWYHCQLHVPYFFLIF